MTDLHGVPDRTDVLVIGAGPSGAVVARELAGRGFGVVCLEQGDWVNNDQFPGDKVEWELLVRERWHADPNVRRSPADYPLDVSQADVSPIMFAGVGGSSLLYSGHWMRMLPSDFRMRTMFGVGHDWPLTYSELSPYYDRMDAAVGLAGLGGDPAYPPMADPPLPPHPIGAIGRRAAAGMDNSAGIGGPDRTRSPASDSGSSRSARGSARANQGAPRARRPRSTSRTGRPRCERVRSSSRVRACGR